MGYTPMRLSCETTSPPAKVAKSAKAEGCEGRPALATLAALAGVNTHAAFSTAAVCDFEECAAIAEYDGGAPRDWAEAFAKLQCLPVPEGVSAAIWIAMIDGAGRWLDQKGASHD